MRLAGSALLGACLLRVWQMLLLRQLLEAPGVVALWIAGTALLAILVWRPLRNQLVLVGLLAVLLFLFHWGYERAASDGREYFAQARSLVMDRDFNFTNENATLGARGAAKMYPIGVAILWAPFMLLAHGWLMILNLLGGTYALDGYTNPYQRAVGLGSLLYGFAGLVMVSRVLRDYFSAAMASTVTVVIAAGTFFLWYLTVENSMTHGASMFGATLFLYLWHRGRPRPDAGGRMSVPPLTWWIGLGVATGVMSMVRWQNATFAAVAMLVTMWQLRRALRPVVVGVLAFGLSAFIGFFPQLLFWKIVRGSWLSVPAADHGFDLGSLHVFDVLFSPNHGLLATTPLVYVALFGLPFFVRRDRPLAFVLIGGFLAQLIVNSGSGDWWGGPSFGARRFDSSMLVLAVGLASLLVWLRRRPLVAPAIGIAVILAVNLSLMVDVRNRTLLSAAAVTVPEAANSVYARVGNPFSFPFNAYVAWKYDADWALYDKLRGRTYSNIDIDLGEAGDDMFLGHGWLSPERNEAMTFRWATGAQATLVVPLRSPATYRLEFVCSPFAYPGSPRQTMEITINRARITEIPLQPGVTHYQVDVPAGAWRTNLNQIQFVFGYSRSPSEAGLSADGRSLAVMFDSIRLKVLTGQ